MGYMNVPQGRNPWISEPQQPQINQRSPFPRYHTSSGNVYRSWGGDAETNVGSRLGQIAYGQSMYVSEWIRPQIDANDAKAKAKAAAAAQQQSSNQPQPPSVTQAMSRNHKRTTLGNAPQQPSQSQEKLPGRALPTTGSGYSPSAPLPWLGGQKSFSSKLPANVLKFANQGGTPSSSAALPGSDEPVGPTQPRMFDVPTNPVAPRVRRPSGRDARKRGTFQQLSIDYE